MLASGWGGLAGEEGPQSEQIFFLRHAPHAWLFPRMSAAVHHGGAGTTAAAVRAGIPSVIVPFYGDQPFWARCLNRQGVAPPAVDRKGLTADTLASALAAAQHPSMIQKAMALGNAVRVEDGIGEAVRCLREWGLLPAVTDGRYAAAVGEGDSMTHDVGAGVGKTVGEMRSSASRPRQRNIRSRRLLLLERTMYRDGRTPFASVFSMQLLGRLEEGRLLQALSRLQAKHPLLRCVIEDGADSDGPRFVLQDRPAPIPLRIVERKHDDDWQTEVRREWVAPFDAGRDPLVRLVWLRASEVSELILVGHHCICDGQSGMTLLRECLSAYDEPEKDLGTYDALGAIEDVVPAALLQDRSFRRRMRWKIGLLRLVLLWQRRKRAGSASLIYRRADVLPSVEPR